MIMIKKVKAEGREVTYTAQYTGASNYRVYASASVDGVQVKKPITADMDAQGVSSYFLLLDSLPEMAMHHYDMLAWKPVYLKENPYI